MNKKFLTILLVSVFLITSLGVISAADDSDSVSVKIIWDDNVNVKPDYVTVNLLNDGKIVDTAKLNASDSWKVKFSIDDDGNYQVKDVISSDYSTDIEGNVQDGFVIKIKSVENDVLGVTDDETPVEESSENDVVSDDTQTISDDQSDTKENGNSSDSNSTDSNSTDSNSTDSNSTVDDDSDDAGGADDSDDKTTTTTKTTKTITKKVAKEDKKKPKEAEKLKKTGFPLVVLVIALFVAIFVPFARKK